MSTAWRALVSVLVLPAVLVWSAYSQEHSADPSSRAWQYAQSQREFERRAEQLRDMSRNSSAVPTSVGPRAIPPLLTSAEKRALVPASEDRERYATFLRGRDTGLVRVLRRSKDAHVVSAAELAGRPEIRDEMVSCYSFSRRAHGGGPWTEIVVTREAAYVGVAPGSVGLLGRVGHLPIESVDATHPCASYLAGLAQPRTYQDAYRLCEQARTGIVAGEYVYARALRVSPGSSYVLRSIKPGGADVLVVFHVVRESDDGWVTIVWKTLARSRAPQLKEK